MLLCSLRSTTVCALTYHRINAGQAIFPGLDVDIFREQMTWLKRRCRILHPDEFSDSLDAPRSTVPRVLVTFDDGYRDFLEVAYPILHELKIPALLFLPTAFIGANDLIWTDALTAAMTVCGERSGRLPVSRDVSMQLNSPVERRRFVQRANTELKKLPDRERREALGQLLAELRVEAPQRAVDRQMLDWNEVRALMPLTTIGGHSHQHPILAGLSPDEQRSDLTISTQLLRRELGSSPRYFAYPNGTQRDFTPTTQQILRELGYELAFSTIAGLNGGMSDRFSLLRQPTGCRTVNDFAWLVHGLTSG